MLGHPDASIPAGLAPARVGHTAQWARCCLTSKAARKVQAPAAWPAYAAGAPVQQRQGCPRDQAIKLADTDIMSSCWRSGCNCTCKPLLLADSQVLDMIRLSDTWTATCAERPGAQGTAGCAVRFAAWMPAFPVTKC